MNRLLRVRTGRQPHEVFVLVATLILGLIGTVVPERVSAAVALTLPWPWASVLWVGMVVFAGLTLWGIFRPKIEGLLVERLGLVVLTLFYAVYVVLVIIYAEGWGAVVSTSLPSAFAAGNVWRVIQIRRDLALLTSYLKDHPGEEVR